MLLRAGSWPVGVQFIFLVVSTVQRRIALFDFHEFLTTFYAQAIFQHHLPKHTLLSPRGLPCPVAVVELIPHALQVTFVNHNTSSPQINFVATVCKVSRVPVDYRTPSRLMAFVIAAPLY
jgi:hypothetical protein